MLAFISTWVMFLTVPYSTAIIVFSREPVDCSVVAHPTSVSAPVSASVKTNGVVFICRYPFV
ncbi:MAG: hypothetical protein OES35_11080, partial [Chromatiales bacterium]|nr:hypothetical protein [Chromatiales bacterium]